MGTISRNCFPFATDVLGGASDTKPTLMARTISPRLVTLPLDSHLETRGCPEEGHQFREVPLADLQNELLLPDLLARRKAADVLFLAKLLNGLLDCPSLLAQVDIRIPSATRSRDLFGRRHSRRDYDFHGPLARMMRLGNNFCHLVDLFHDSVSTILGRVLASLRGPV
ncbi:Scm-like protein with four mbt domains [Homalodisca vitripennis]|nr:Scm-like protein with four mbt domains [Homalodisca vitripennis]